VRSGLGFEIEGRNELVKKNGTDIMLLVKLIQYFINISKELNIPTPLLINNSPINNISPYSFSSQSPSVSHILLHFPKHLYQKN
jgi:hypothetical protein